MARFPVLAAAALTGERKEKRRGTLRVVSCIPVLRLEFTCNWKTLSPVFCLEIRLCILSGSLFLPAGRCLRTTFCCFVYLCAFCRTRSFYCTVLWAAFGANKYDFFPAYGNLNVLYVINTIIS